MKRALAVLLVCMGFAAFAQFPAFKGSWSATVGLIPSVTLSSTLTLTTTISGFDVSFTMGFGATGLTSFGVSYKGGLGPISLSGKMRFDPGAPMYEVGQLTTSLDFAGLLIGLTVNHWVDGKWDPVYFGYPSGTPEPCPDPNPVGGNLQYVLTTKITPFDLRIRFVDCSAGTAFQDLRVSVTGIGLCCGISLNATLDFNKEGFQSLALTGLNIPLCCGVSLDVITTFTVDSKKVELKPKFAGFAEACFTVWGDAVFRDNTWGGIEIYGYRISCTIGDCNTFEIIHAWNVSKVNPLLPTADRFRTSVTCGDETVTLGEFELYKLTFCGPGCCGGRYTVDLRLFFGSGGGLFDITRLVYSVSLPIMTNFSVSISGTMYTIPALGPCNTLSVGWTFTF